MFNTLLLQSYIGSTSFYTGPSPYKLIFPHALEEIFNGLWQISFAFGKKKKDEMGGAGGFWLSLIQVSFEKQPNK